jgi:hypothetical protein
VAGDRHVGRGASRNDCNRALIVKARREAVLAELDCAAVIGKYPAVVEETAGPGRSLQYDYSRSSACGVIGFDGPIIREIQAADSAGAGDVIKAEET